MNAPRHRGPQELSDERRIRSMKRLLDEQGVAYTCRVFVQALRRIGGEERPLAAAIATVLTAVNKAELEDVG